MNLQELRDNIEAATEEYRDAVKELPWDKASEFADKVKAAKAELAVAITDGAAPCPTCGGHPHGMDTAFRVRGATRHAFEIGCTNCLDHRAFGITREEAVANFNRGIDGLISPTKARAYIDALKRVDGDHAAARALAKAGESSIKVPA